MYQLAILILIILIIAFCKALITDNSKSNKEKEKELNYRVSHNVTPSEDREYNDEPNTELTDEDNYYDEKQKLNIHPVRLREFIFDYAANITGDCSRYLKTNFFMDDKKGQRDKQTFIKDARGCIAAETLVALYSMCYVLFRQDLEEEEWNTLYSYYIYKFWDSAYNEGRFSFDGFGTIDYDNLIEKRIRIYETIITDNQSENVYHILEDYVDYHCQMLLSILEKACVSIYEPAIPNNDTINKSTKADILYQIIDLSEQKITNSNIEPYIKRILRKWYSRFLNLR